MQNYLRTVGIRFSMADVLQQLAKESAFLEYQQENDETKSQNWLKMASVLEANNYEKTKIAKRVKQLIEEQLKKLYEDNKKDPREAKLKSGHFYNVMSKGGYTDPAFDHRSQESVTAQERENTSTVASEKPYATFRNQLIEYFKDIKEEAESCINELLIDDVIIEATINDKTNNMKKGDKVKMSRNWAKFFDENTTEFFKLWGDMFYADQTMRKIQKDARYSIVPNMRLAVFAFMSFVLPKYFCSRFFSEVKNASTITTKKYKQFVQDIFPDGTKGMAVSDLLNMVKEDSWKWNFIDVPCPTCGIQSLKLKIFDDGTWKFICKNKKAHSKETLFSAELLAKTEKILSKKKVEAQKFLEAKSISIPST